MLHEIAQWRWPIDFLGELTGVAVALVYITLWIATAGPIQEWVREMFEKNQDRPSGTNAPVVEVLVSDLHIDTWDYPAQPGKRAQNFPDFLDAVRQEPGIDGFILNGDLMDIPLFAGGPKESLDPPILQVESSALPERGVLAASYDHVLCKLLTLERAGGLENEDNCVRRAIVQTGNHDIGVCGLRYSRNGMPGFLPPIRVAWSPEILLSHGPQEGQEYDNAIYIEHGHHYDPLLWLYMRYAVLDLLRGGQTDPEQGLAGSMQRQGRVGMGRWSKGSGWMARRAAGSSATSELQPDPAPQNPSSPDWDYKDNKLTPVEWLVRYRFRQAARRAFRLLRKRGCGDKLRTVTFGHIHIPDRHVFPNGDVYVNSGDWSGLSPHQSYCVIHSDGTMRGPFQWKDQARFRQTLKAAGD